MAAIYLLQNQLLITRIVTLLFQVEISGNEQLDSIIRDAKNIENVFDVQRANPGNYVNDLFVFTSLLLLTATWC